VDQPNEFFEQASPPPRLTKSQARAARRAEKASTGGSGAPLTAKTDNQRRYIDRLKRGQSLFAIGPAGTGKTYLPARIAARKLLDKQLDKFIIVRATVEPNKRHALGFKPGKQDDKLAPWMIPVLDGLRAEMSGVVLDKLKNEKRIEFAPFESMRGRTFNNAILLIDEAQNLTTADLKLVLTRIGEDCQVIVTGDTEQTDIPDSGLARVVAMTRRHQIEMPVVVFDEDDVVRSAMTKAWVKAFAAEFGSTAAFLDDPPAFLQNGRLVPQ